MKKPGPSILNIMAEAMLAEDYRSSHENLKEYAEGQQEKLDSEKRDDNNNKRKPAEEKEATNTIVNDAEETQHSRCPSEEEDNEEERNVVIQDPPKRRKISNACSFRTNDVVQGSCPTILFKERMFRCSKYMSRHNAHCRR